MAHNVTRYYSCDVSELGVGPMEHDLDDEAIEVGPDGSETIAPLADPLEIPIGWVEVTIRQVVPNPERAEEVARQLGGIESEYQSLLSLATEAGEQITDAQKRAIRLQVERGADPIESAAYAVRVIRGHLSPEYAALVRGLGPRFAAAVPEPQAAEKDGAA